MGICFKWDSPHCEEMITFINVDNPLRYELREFELKPDDSNESVLVCPWVSLWQRGLLYSLPNISYKYTFCKYHLMGTPIQKKIEQMGIQTVFTPHCSTGDSALFETRPLSHYAHGECVPLEKEVLFSFIGWDEINDTRSRMLQLLNGQPNIIRRQYGFWRKGNDSDATALSEYASLLGKSRFSLCPKGCGPGTMRFWESLKCGAIPVLLSDTIILPLDWDWGNTIIRLSETSLFTERNSIDRAIRSIPEGKENLMRANCLAAFAKFDSVNYIKGLLI